MIGARASFALILALVAGCGSGTQSTKQRATEVCTGVEQLQMGALTLPPPSRAPPGMQVMWENGSRFVYVDGTCRYWALPPLPRWAEVRTGVLTPLEEQALISRLRYESWSGWAGELHPGSGLLDADVVILSEGMRPPATVLCFGGCIGAPVPPELQGVAGGLADLAAELWSAGVPVSGDVWFVLVREEVSELPVQYWDWPLAADASGLAIGELEASELAWGHGHRASAADADALRALRAEFASSPVAELVPHLPIKDARGDRYKLFLRDAMPYEDEAGLIRPH
jgi:hypothetical protein